MYPIFQRVMEKFGKDGTRWIKIARIFDRDSEKKLVEIVEYMRDKLGAILTEPGAVDDTDALSGFESD